MEGSLGAEDRPVFLEYLFGTMNEGFTNALQVVTERGESLRTDWRFDWPEVLQQAAHRLRLGCSVKELPVLVAIVGGASSGKSTVFNNLLDGHLASRITARGHATLGPILAVHENRRQLIERLLGEGQLLPGLRRVSTELDDNTAGKPDAVATLFHTIDVFRDVLLFDLPDFTSEDARREGDITMSLLPWFDRIVVIVDHERWFDRQSISLLRTQSVRFGQQRWVLFNRTREDALSDDDREALIQQARRLTAEGISVLEFRRGRGFCLFPPGTLDNVHEFLQGPVPVRTHALSTQVAEGANRVLNQNEERTDRLDELRRSLDATVGRTLPDARECMTSLMTSPERKQLEFVSRVLRIEETKEWLRAQTRRLQHALKRVPVVGAIVGGPFRPIEEKELDTTDRPSIAISFFEAVAQRQNHDVRRTVRASAFWDEIHRWTGLETAQREFTWDPTQREEVRTAAKKFDTALTEWIGNVEAQCRGVSPHLTGAIGAGAIGLTIVLIAAPGPVAALTLLSAKGAIGAAFTQLATAAGAGALLGKPLGRLTTLVEEKLLGSAEFDAVQTATTTFQALLEANGRRLTNDAIAEAGALVMDHDYPLAKALESLREPPEVSP